MSESDNPTSNDKIYLENARTPEQLADMQEIAVRDICFMCPEYIPEYYEQRGGLVEEGEHSYLVLNGFPYENTEYHLMVIPKQHATKLEEVSDEFLVEAFDKFKMLEKEYNITGGSIAMRFGKMSETGSTVQHLHMHFIVAKKDIGPDDKPVRFRMSRSFEDELDPYEEIQRLRELLSDADDKGYQPMDQ